MHGTIPSGRFEHSLSAMGPYIFLFGGGNTQSWLNDVYVFDTGKRLLGIIRLCVSVSNIPFHFLCHGCGVSLLLLIPCLSCLSGPLCSDTLTWALAPVDGRPPKGRCAHSWLSAGSKMILYGGYDGASRLKDTVTFQAGTQPGGTLSVFGADAGCVQILARGSL